MLLHVGLILHVKNGLLIVDMATMPQPIMLLHARHVLLLYQIALIVPDFGILLRQHV